MTAERHHRPTAAGGRPNLSVITSCPGCGAATTKVVDRDGKPVIFDAGPDGRAVRDPYGGWWVARYRGSWTVVKPAPGEDPPTTGRGERLREHDCAGPEVALLKAVFGAEVLATFEVAELPDVAEFPELSESAPGLAAGSGGEAGGEQAAAPGRRPDREVDGHLRFRGTKTLEEVRADGFYRPRERGRGNEGPVCVERLRMPQTDAAGGPPYTTLCVRCGRLTYRRDLDGVGWCGGYVAEPRHGPPWYPGRDTGVRVVDTV